MAAFNVVRFKVKPGLEQTFVDAHRTMRPAFKGFLGGSLIKTGERTYCLVGEWRAFRSIETARPQMIAFLDGFRHMLEDLGGGLGVTDPVSGAAVVRLPATKGAKKKTPSRRKPAKTKAKKTKPKKAAGKRRR
jgi:hypothetical protein